MGRLHGFWCLNKTWTPPIGTFDALKIVKNIIKLKNLWSLKVKGVKNSKNINHQMLQRPVPKHQQIFLMLFYCY
jgi:hypothetical protein